MRKYGLRVAEHTEAMFDGCRKLREAGVPILLGTDTPILGASAGYSTHFELAMLVDQCGYSPAQALAIATGQPGDILGDWLALPGLGHIREGAPADLLVVTGDPTRNIQDLSQISHIIARGKLVERNVP